MIEIVNKFHTQRLFATSLKTSDLWRAVYYAGYRGDVAKIPFYYKVVHGHSAVSDLRNSMEDLVGLMKSNTRNEIRRAEREGIDFSSDVSFEEFVPYYNAFCESKGLDDRVTVSRLAKYDKTVITKASYQGEVLAMHATVVNIEQKMAFLLFSCSPRLDAGVDKKLIGWGNRFLHYKDFEYLKTLGIETYDWSGICPDPEDPRYSIGQFKLSFGGKLIDSYVLRTPLYCLMESARNMIYKIKKHQK